MDSIFLESIRRRSTQEDELVESLSELVPRESPHWQWRFTAPWILLAPEPDPTPAQGWKLHVSATPRSAKEVLLRVARVLLAERCCFKFAANLEVLERLNSAHWAREGAGKFITIYPRDDEQAVRIAEACHVATGSLEGPLILSDRQYKPRSIVHYRFGGFKPNPVLTIDGSFRYLLHSPDGEPCRDVRKAWFSPPPWVRDPFPREAESQSRPEPGPAVLAGRYQVESVLRHANKGGVYKAKDLEDGSIVLIKEARPFVECSRDGRDSRDRLRHEFEILQLLADTELAPKPVELFVFGGHTFLAEEFLEGQTLRELVVASFDAAKGGLPGALAATLAAQIFHLLSACHRIPLIVRDFNPNNLFVRSDGDLCLIDLELAYRPGHGQPFSGMTPGFASQEQAAGGPPCLEDDLYSLGATLFFLVSRQEPFLLPDDSSAPEKRSARDRLEEILVSMQREGLIPEGMTEGISGCLDDDPEERRRSFEALGERIESPAGGSSRGRAEVEAGEGSDAARQATRVEISPEKALSLAEDAALYLFGSMRLESTGRPWKVACFGERTDSCNVQHGASGVGHFLAQNPALLEDEERRQSLGDLARWVAQRAEQERNPCSGLYFGLAGPSWFLLEAARALGDRELQEVAVRIAERLPESLLLDITHGAAGRGLTQLLFFETTGNDVFRRKAEEACEYLESCVQERSGEWLWPVPEDLDSEFRGGVHYGFAHGSAGICYFLLCAAAVLERDSAFEVASRGVETLLRAASLADERAYWPYGPDRPTLGTFWCNGSSGVATTLIRYYALTGNQECKRLSEMAANAVLHERWISSPVQCHGLAGQGELLLDMYRYTGEERWMKEALHLGGIIYTYRVRRNGHWTFPNETRSQVSSDFSVGLAGVGSYLYRLHGLGPRSFMLDDALESRLSGNAVKATPERAVVQPAIA